MYAIDLCKIKVKLIEYKERNIRNLNKKYVISKYMSYWVMLNRSVTVDNFCSKLEHN